VANVNSLRFNELRVWRWKEPKALSSELSDALALEDHEFMKSLVDVNAEATEEIKLLERQLAKQGLLQSGPRYVRETEIRFEKVSEVIDRAIDKRKQLSRVVPDLLSPTNLTQLREKLVRYVDGALDAEHRRLAMPGNPFTQGSTAIALSRQAGMKADALKVAVAQGLEILRLESRLGLNEESKSVTLNISNSTIAGLNLGTVVGDLNASVQTLNSRGQPDLANAISKLAEALAKSLDVQPDRQKELLEHLALVSTEMALPSEKRKMGPLRSSINALREGVALAGQLAALWTPVEQILKTTGVLSS
jgi:hypothetical protein